MTQDEIIRMAEQAGVLVTIGEGGMWVMTEPGNEKQVMNFANLIIEAAVLAEREACAKVCEELSERYLERCKNFFDERYAAAEVAATECAAAIRARGEK